MKKALAEEFKAACARDGTSIAGTISSFMREHLGCLDEPPSKSTKGTSIVSSTRAYRRKQVCAIISSLEMIRDAEEDYQDRIPENLQDSVRADAAMSSISALSDAIYALSDAY